MATATQQAPRSSPAAQAVEARDRPDESLLDQVIERTLERMDSLSSRFTDELSAGHSALRRAMVTARAMEILELAITPDVMRLAMRLMNSDLGFMTDKDPAKAKQGDKVIPYGEATVKRCLIQAAINGVRWSGNEFNIIAGRFYITQLGYARKCRELAGMKNLELIPGVPRVVEGVTLVRMGARWQYNGIAQEFRDADDKPGIVFPIIAYQGSTADNVIGKAKRKAYKLIFDRCTGSELDDEAGEMPMGEVPASAPLQVGRQSLRAPTDGKANGNGTAVKADEQTQPAPPDPTPADELATAEQHAEISQLLADSDIVVHRWAADFRQRHGGRDPNQMTAAEAEVELVRLRALSTSGDAQEG